MIRFKYLLLMVAFAGCSTVETKKVEIPFYESQLFHDVQMGKVFHDSKTFVDCTPKRDIQSIIRDYNDTKNKPDFDLKTFVSMNFDQPVRPKSTFATDTTRTMEEHLTALWPVLTRKAAHAESRSSLLALPNDYVVPGGRFSEVYYWDSYFTILGLKAQNRYELIHNVVKNFSWLIDSLGFIPNGNRNYYLTRSQPPFFSLIVRELEEYDSLAADHYLEAMVKEYSFWMTGVDSLKNPGDAYRHVVRLDNTTVMNRYWDAGDIPRPEAYKEDYTLAENYTGDKKKLYRDIRAAAESGWDFSSRWFADGKSLQTIHTTDIIPVDLNCLMAHLEKMISKGFAQRKIKDASYEYERRAHDRAIALSKYCWDPSENFFFDYDFVAAKRTAARTLAGVYPLFFEMTQKDVASKTARVIQRDFLKPGGVVTSLVDTDQQWDAPNGWAPLQWLAYKGLKNYGLNTLADDIRNRWVAQTERVYEATGKMMEKYNVVDTTLIGGGGEYPNQDGFGWTNGIALAFIAESRVRNDK